MAAGGRTHRLKVSGYLSARNNWEAEGLRDVLLTDPGTAQSILGQPGKLSQIDLILQPGQEQDLKTLLKPPVQLESVLQENQALQSMTRSFSLNLTALSLLALLVGMFLVYNTINFSVLQRRPLLASLRSLGVTQGEILRLILAETLVITSLGIVAGTLLGIWMGQISLSLVLRTINDLYYALEVSTFSLNPWSLLKGWLTGLLAALLACLFPAWEAAQTTPAGALRRSHLENLFIQCLPWLFGTGLLLLVLGTLLMAWPRQSLWLSLVVSSFW